MEEKVKHPISQDDAIKLVFHKLAEMNMLDKLWELAHNELMKIVEEVSENNDVVGFDGQTYLDTDDVAWYDEIHDTFALAFMTKAQSTLNKSEE